jgi:nucleotide-binding universal stress UspA family protein
MDAFAHALRIALAAKCKLYLLHVASRDDETSWASFPPVRRALADWGLMEADAPPAAVAERLGIKVAKVQLEAADPVQAIRAFIDEHPSELIVLATEGRKGLPRWLHGSMAERLSRSTKIMTLFISSDSRGFVDQQSGAIQLKRVLVPVDHKPPPADAVATIQNFTNLLDAQHAEMKLIHVGDTPPEINGATGLSVEMRSGDPVEAIVEAARSASADLIALPTAGHHGFLDALRGSTTERVLRDAPSALLAVPV